MDLREVDGIEFGPLGDESLTNAVRELELVRHLLLEQGIASGSPALLGAAGAVLTASMTVLSAIDYKCNLADPHEDIAARPDPDSGDLILKCYHNSSQNSGPHCWNGSGKKISCP